MKNILLFLFSFLMVSQMSQANTVRIGSGGDSQEGEQVPEELLIDTLDKIQRDAQFLIHSWMWNPEKSPLTAEQLEQLRQIVINTPVEVLREKACTLGNEVKDAVAYSSPTNSICISTFALKSKLRIDNFKSQVLALMTHEYSHLIGFDETQATSLQQQTLRYLALNGYANPGPLQVRFYGQYERHKTFSRLSKDKKELYKYLADYVAEAKTRMATYDSLLETVYPALAPQDDFGADVLVRINYIEILVDGYQASRGDNGSQEELDMIFKGSSSISSQDFNARMRLKMVRNFQRPGDVLPRIGVKTATGDDFAKLVYEIEEMDQKIQIAFMNIYAGRNLVKFESAKP
ncbi:hypothetical protein ACLVWU_12850 [Bdellovibrio sp. HCB290]|uniref:hypothetical protein n=1 Tax=Bdellovibrio sp. HCB290 TaxID=3394356 RepID=UPI0039B3BF96